MKRVFFTMCLVALAACSGEDSTGGGESTSNLGLATIGIAVPVGISAIPVQ
mgnify:CR=1 FL=1